jgi:transcriptional regulator with XRE-family HTH domain
MNHQNLRAVRKKSPLKQADISFLLGVSEDARISHWERGRRNPSTEIKLLYHIIFGLPVDSLFTEVASTANNEIIARLKLRIAQLESTTKDARTLGRIDFLRNVLTRLTT